MQPKALCRVRAGFSSPPRGTLRRKPHGVNPKAMILVEYDHKYAMPISRMQAAWLQVSPWWVCGMWMTMPCTLYEALEQRCRLQTRAIACTASSAPWCLWAAQRRRSSPSEALGSPCPRTPCGLQCMTSTRTPVSNLIWTKHPHQSVPLPFQGRTLTGPWCREASALQGRQPLGP